MFGKIISVAAILLSTIMVSCSSSSEQQQTQEVKTTYKLVTLEPKNSQTVMSYTAAIRGKQDIEIYPQVGGYLSQIKVNEGERVKAGQTLFIIEQGPFIASVKAAQANVELSKASLATAELNYDNTKTLRDKNIVSEADLLAKRNTLQSAIAALSMAQAQLQSAQANLDFTVIKSPSDGVVSTLPYRKGALVSAASPQSLTVVSDNSEMFVYFSMSENQVLDLLEEHGSLERVIEEMPELNLQLNNGSVYPIQGRIESISGSIDQKTGAVSMRAKFANPNQHLLSGGVGNILITEQVANSIVIPKTATFEVQDKTFVYKVVDNKAKSTMISVSKSGNDREFIVSSGLNSGDVIIAEGAGLVRDGAPVNQ